MKDKFKDEREVFKDFIAELDILIARTEKKEEFHGVEECKKGVEDEWSENKYNFMRKYGHL